MIRYKRALYLEAHFYPKSPIVCSSFVERDLKDESLKREPQKSSILGSPFAERDMTDEQKSPILSRLFAERDWKDELLM